MTTRPNIPFTAFFRALGVNVDARAKLDVKRELGIPLPPMTDLLPAIGIGVRISCSLFRLDITNRTAFQMESLAPGGTAMRVVYWGPPMAGSTIRYDRRGAALSMVTPVDCDLRNFGQGQGVNTARVGGLVGTLGRDLFWNGSDARNIIDYIFIPQGQSFVMQTDTLGPSFGMNGSIAWTEYQEVLPQESTEVFP